MCSYMKSLMEQFLFSPPLPLSHLHDPLPKWGQVNFQFLMFEILLKVCEAADTSEHNCTLPPIFLYSVLLIQTAREP